MTYVITEYVRVIPSSPYVRVITSSQYVRVVTSYTSRPAKIRGPHGVTLRQHPASVRTALSPGPAARADSEQEDSGWKRQLQDLARQRDERYITQFYSFSSSVSFITQEADPGPGPPHTPLGPRLVRHPFLGTVSYPLAAPARIWFIFSAITNGNKTYGNIITDGNTTYGNIIAMVIELACVAAPHTHHQPPAPSR